MALKEDSKRIENIQKAIEKAQAVVRQYIPDGRCLSDELIRERKTISSDC
jgi:hypothetical protein